MKWYKNIWLWISVVLIIAFIIIPLCNGYLIGFVNGVNFSLEEPYYLLSVAVAVVVAVFTYKIYKKQLDLMEEQKNISKTQTEISIAQTNIMQEQKSISSKQTDIMEQQNKIALFEKRYELFSLLMEFGAILELLNNKRENINYNTIFQIINLANTANSIKMPYYNFVARFIDIDIKTSLLFQTKKNEEITHMLASLVQIFFNAFAHNEAFEKTNKVLELTIPQKELDIIDKSIALQGEYRDYIFALKKELKL